MFSVVIPLYNKEHSIRNTIQSVLEQSFQDFEIVVVNDGCTDLSTSVVESFKDPRIRLIHQDNQGVSAARNRGILESRFDWIAFLDGDDEWYNSKLERFADSIEENPEANWGFSGYTLHIDGVLKKKHSYELESNILVNIFEALSKGIKIQTSSVIVRKSFLIDNNILFTVGINNSEDRELWYKLGCCDTMPLYINKPLSKYMYFSGQESLTKDNLYNKSFHFLSMKERIESFSRKLDDKDRRILDTIIERFNRKAIVYYWANLDYVPLEFSRSKSYCSHRLLLTTVKFPVKMKMLLFKIYIRVCGY